jgi:hypothetical protein
MGRFESGFLATDDNIATLADLSGIDTTVSVRRSSATAPFLDRRL